MGPMTLCLVEMVALCILLRLLGHPCPHSALQKLWRLDANILDLFLNTFLTSESHSVYARTIAQIPTEATSEEVLVVLRNLWRGHAPPASLPDSVKAALLVFGRKSSQLHGRLMSAFATPSPASPRPVWTRKRYIANLDYFFGVFFFLTLCRCYGPSEAPSCA